jgi:hypothetical protein
MKIRDDRVYKLTWTATAQAGSPHAPDTIELIDQAENVIATLGTDEAINVLEASRITAEYNTDDETNATVDFTFDIIAGTIDPPSRTLHDPYVTLATAISNDTAKSVPITPGPQWLRASLTIATADMTAGKNAILYIRVIV